MRYDVELKAADGWSFTAVCQTSKSCDSRCRPLIIAAQLLQTCWNCMKVFWEKNLY